jgi:hypothetical protein
MSVEFIHLDGRSANEAVAKFIIDAYQLPVPDLILSIQTDGVNIENQETKSIIHRGIAATAKITSE